MLNWQFKVNPQTIFKGSLFSGESEHLNLISEFIDNSEEVDISKYEIVQTQPKEISLAKIQFVEHRS